MNHKSKLKFFTAPTLVKLLKWKITNYLHCRNVKATIDLLRLSGIVPKMQNDL